ncbi:MAG: hypothetical protein WAU88_10080 [Candidatus Zixiibacteriota bacterium]
MNRRVLIVCYYFPPLGLAGIGRPLNLFKYLPKHNWDCHILTVKPVTYRAYEPELLHGLDLSRIHRSGSYDPQRLMYLAGLRKVGKKTLAGTAEMRSRYFPDSKRGWIGPAVRLGKKLIREFNYDVLISTSPPISSHLVACKLAKETKIKWVADFRDFWTSTTIDDYYGRSPRAERAYDLLRFIHDQSTCMTAVNNSVASYVGADEVISNGYDPVMAQNWKAPEFGQKFAIGILGTLGEWNPVDPLIDLLQAVISTRGCDPSKLSIVHVGNCDDNSRMTLDRATGLGVEVISHGLQPRQETIELLSSSHCIFHSLSLGSGKGLTTARIFDSLASGRPILAYGDQGGEVDLLLAGTGNALRFDNQTTGAAADYLVDLIGKWKNGTVTITPTPAYALPYRWDNIAGQFAKLFDSLL